MLELQAEGVAYAEAMGPRNSTGCVGEGYLVGLFLKHLLTLILDTSLASLVAQRVKHLPAMQDTWV